MKILLLAVGLPLISQAAVVTNLTQAGLEAALAEGGTVTFGSSGTISLTTNLTIAADTVIDGGSNSIVISGGRQTRMFIVTNRATLGLINLQISGGRSTNGGAIFNHGFLNLAGCTFSNNVATGASGFDGSDARGNGRSGGSGGSGKSGFGGAIYNLGSLFMTNCVFTGNGAEAGDGGNGGDGESDSLFGGSGGRGGHGGKAWGGAIFNKGSLSIVASTFSTNDTAAGSGGVGGMGGSAPFSGKSGRGGIAGTSLGGAIWNQGTLVISNSTFVGNTSKGGNTARLGTTGGPALGGGIYTLGRSAIIVVNSTLTMNSSLGGTGGGASSSKGSKGGSGGGGGLYSSGPAVIINSTFAMNDAVGGQGSAGETNSSRGASLGGNIFRRSGSVRLVNTILAKGSSGPNCTGRIIDGGRNISSDASAKFKSANGSLNNTDARLVALADRGGPTKTMALRSSSPAIDKADPNFCPPTDQRGITRPQGAGYDIGAYESTEEIPDFIFSISGRISSGTNPVAGVTVTAGTNSSLSDTQGFYSITELAAGTYTVIPQAAGKIFSPSNRVVTVGTNATNAVTGGNATNINFQALVDTNASPGIFSIGGQITDGTNGVSGVTVTAGPTNAVSGTNGIYLIRGLATGTYVVVPSLIGATFSPSNQPVFVGTNAANPTGTNAANINFLASIGTNVSEATFRIRGRISENQVGIADVTVSAGTNSAVSGAEGDYVIQGLRTGTYTVIPTAAGTNFSPVSREVFVGTNDLENVDFEVSSFPLPPPPPGAPAPDHSATKKVLPLRFPAEADRVYHVQASSDLVQWVTISTNLSSKNGLVELTHTNLVEPPQQFFRILKAVPAD